MKAIIADGYGGPEVLKVGERPMPTLASDEVLIRVDYAGINRAETLQRQGLYPPPPGATDVLGLECAGRIVLNPESAGTPDEKLSDQHYIALLSGGGYAQYAKVCKEHIIEVPAGSNYEQIAGITEVWATAYQILHFV